MNVIAITAHTCGSTTAYQTDTERWCVRCGSDLPVPHVGPVTPLTVTRDGVTWNRDRHGRWTPAA